MSQAVEWARSVKQDLVELEQLTGIPAVFAAAQMIHEAFDYDGTMTSLAKDHFNFGGMKWAEWQKAFGCTPISFDSPEEINGVWTNVKGQAFCSCPSWETWLVVYASLLHDVYPECFAYKDDPLLFGYHVGKKWATDSRYIGKVASWMSVIWEDYRKTKLYPAKLIIGDSEYETTIEDDKMSGHLRPLVDELLKMGWSQEWDGANRSLILSPPVNVTVTVDGVEVSCHARLENGKTRVDLKPVANAMTAIVGWSNKTRTADVKTRHIRDPYLTQ